MQNIGCFSEGGLMGERDGRGWAAETHKISRGFGPSAAGGGRGGYPHPFIPNIIATPTPHTHLYKIFNYHGTLCIYWQIGVGA